jgi:uncharacterized protein (TIGR02145 family)
MGAIVTIRAGNPPASDQRFKKWTVTGGGATLDNVKSSTTTFIMPGNAVEVKASFELFFTDARDNKTYSAVKIGDQVWMAENLNYAPNEGGSWCYGNDTKECNTFGRLYTHSAAMTACPVGWSLPNQTEWTVMLNSVGAPTGTKLKAQSPAWNGTDEFGFSALPGGYKSNASESFSNVNTYGYWWSSTVDGSNRWRIYLTTSVTGYNHGVVSPNYGYSVRCIKDQ